jgi:hypothetical protein
VSAVSKKDEINIKTDSSSHTKVDPNKKENSTNDSSKQSMTVTKAFINSFEPEDTQRHLKLKEKEIEKEKNKEEKTIPIPNNTITISANAEIKSEKVITKEANIEISKETVNGQENLKIEKTLSVTTTPSATSKPVESTTIASSVENLLKKEKLITEITKSIKKREKSPSPKARNERRGGDRSSSRNRRRGSYDRERTRRGNRSSSRDRRGANRSRSRNRRSRERDSSRNRYNRRPSSRERFVKGKVLIFKFNHKQMSFNQKSYICEGILSLGCILVLIKRYS